jgi:phosphoenolpyruvate carboxykinase (ATP)
LLKAVIDGGIGAVFIMLHPSKYAGMLADKMKRYGATAWLVNTGWSGGR